jgi:hypothetical protein
VQPPVYGINALFDRDVPRRVASLALGMAGALIVGYLAAAPSPSIFLRLGVYGTIVIAFALAIPAHVFIPATLLAVGVSTAFPSAVASVGPITLYFSDLAAFVVLLRGAAPRARNPGRHALAGAPQALFLLLAFVMAVAAARAIVAGLPTASVIRGDLALLYWPLFYFGFTRVLAETDLKTHLLWRNLALVAVGFAAYMFVARALGHPFKDPGLSQVPTGLGETVPRNFGFASAFTIYPVLAVAAVAGMANDREHRFRWTLLASIGALATLTTLVRGEIFGLALGILLVLVLSPRAGLAAGRSRTTVQLAIAVAAAMLVVLAVDPRLGQAVIQRSLPFTRQATAATANADYRFKAMGTGIREAREHPAGLGVLDQQALIEHKIDPGYLAHSGFATLLIFGGWVALAVSALVLLAVVRRSFQAPSPSRWLHPAFVGAITILSVYSLSASGLVGDSWVVPLGALVVALRFGLHPKTR